MSTPNLPHANWWEKTFDPQLTAAIAQIAQETGQEVNFLKALALAVNLGVQSSQGTSAPTPTGQIPSRSLQSIETEWVVGAVQGHTLAGLPQVIIVDQHGKPVQIQASQVATYTGAMVILPNAGVRTTIDSISAQGGTTVITFSDPIEVHAGSVLEVYVRPIKVESTGAASVQGTQIYTGTTAMAIPAQTTTAQTTTVSFRPAGLGVEVHRGQVYLVSAQGYNYTVQVEMLLEQIDPDGSVVQTPQSGTLNTESATPAGWLPWDVDPPAVSTIIKFTLTPTAAQPQPDTLTLRWFVDANDTAVDQNPDASKGPPVYVGGVDGSGTVRTVKVDSEGRIVTTASGSAYQGTVGTGSTTTQVVDSVGGWQTNQWTDYAIQFTDDTTTKALQGVWQKISSNTADTLTLAAALPAAPVSGDTYNIRIYGSQVMDINQVNGQPVAYSSLVSPNTTLGSPNAVSVGTTATQLDTGLANRRYLVVFNNGSDTVYVGDSTVTTADGIPVAAGANLTLNLGPNLALYGISGTAGQDVRVLEVA